MVLVKEVYLPDSQPWYSQWAVHSWVDLRLDGVWHRVEIRGRTTGVQVDEIPREQAFRDDRWGGNARVLAVIDGAGDAGRIGAEVLAAAEGFPYRDSYVAWPGPNSNTFIEWLSQSVDGFALQLSPNAVGKDYGGWLVAGVSSTRTGLELETAVVGAQVGLVEGAEVHLLGLVGGIGVWPPSVKLPFLPTLPWGL